MNTNDMVAMLSAGMASVLGGENPYKFKKGKRLSEKQKELNRLHLLWEKERRNFSNLKPCNGERHYKDV